jgi:hypothetical protein
LKDVAVEFKKKHILVRVNLLSGILYKKVAFFGLVGTLVKPILAACQEPKLYIYLQLASCWKIIIANWHTVRNL